MRERESESACVVQFFSLSPSPAGKTADTNPTSTPPFTESRTGKERCRRRQQVEDLQLCGNIGETPSSYQLKRDTTAATFTVSQEKQLDPLLDETGHRPQQNNDNARKQTELRQKDRSPNPLFTRNTPSQRRFQQQVRNSGESHRLFR